MSEEERPRKGKPPIIRVPVEKIQPAIVVYRCDRCGGKFYHLNDFVRHCVKGETIIGGDFKEIKNIAPAENVFGITGVTKVVAIYRRKYSGDMIRIKAAGMLPIELTPEHPILVASSFNRRKRKLSEPYWKFPEEVIPKKWEKPGDYLIVPRLPGLYEIREIDLFGKFITPRGLVNAKNRLGDVPPTSIPLTAEVAWLFGLYVAEGCANHGKVRICLGSHEKDTIDRTIDILEAIGYRTKIEQQTNCSETIIKVHSYWLSNALKEWFGERAENKRVPDFILLHKDYEIVSAFLDGYATGDGSYVRWKTRNRLGKSYECKRLDLQTTSIKLALQLQLMYARLGILPMLTIVDKGGEGEILGRKCKFRTAYKLTISNGEHYKHYVVSERYIATPVRSVERTVYNGVVYNLETEDNTYTVHNVIVHNCVLKHGIPPHLAWRMVQKGWKEVR